MADPKLVQWLGSVSGDPLAFVMGAFPWGEPGRLANETGPNDWQRRLLCMVRDGIVDLNRAVQIATASGHGVGKSCCVAWLILWAITTLPDTKGVVTANTETQLKSKTWAELGKWFHMFIGKDMFKLTATALFQPERERTWRVDLIPWSERNTEAFAGLHNKNRRIIVVFDEASAIPNVIWETTEGALTDADTQIIWCVFGNPTRNTGRFRDCWQRFTSIWKTIKVDSREVPFTNKTQIAQWAEAYGDDSDFFRIRVKGEFPRTGEMEFFSAAEIDAAMIREVTDDSFAPLAIGVDVARFGVNSSVIYFRKGRDGRTIPRQIYQGLSTVALATKVFEANSLFSADGILVDGGGVGGGVVDNLRHMHLHCFDVQFGGKADHIGADTATVGEKYANKRAEIYGALRGWLKTGAIPNDADIRSQLLSITYTFNPRDEIILTSKEVMMREGKSSPDDVDALAITFAYPLARHAFAGGEWPKRQQVESDYDPHSRERMEAA